MGSSRLSVRETRPDIVVKGGGAGGKMGRYKARLQLSGVRDVVLRQGFGYGQQRTRADFVHHGLGYDRLEGR